VAKITPQTKSKSQSKLVRVDHKEQTLNAYWEPKDVNKNTKSKEDDNPVQVPKKRAHKDEGSKDDILDDDFETVSIPTKTSSSNKKKKNSPSKKNNSNEIKSTDVPEEPKATSSTTKSTKSRKPISSQPKKRKKPLLTSVQLLIDEFKASVNSNLTNIFKDYSFVGCVDDNIALIQHQTDLYLCNVCYLSKELMYQECLQNFGEFDYIKLSSPTPIYTLCMLALDAPGSVWRPEDGHKEEIASFIVNLMVKNREMLQEYYRMTIDNEGNLLTLPQIIPGYMPEVGALATFMLRLSTEVEWDEERACFETLSREFAQFYCLQFDEQEPNKESETSGRAWTIEHVLFPALRRRFSPPQSLSEDGSLIRIASVEKLYKVFQRC
jgi:DNA mismatch repair protein MLH1